MVMRAWRISSFSWRWVARLLLPLWAAAAFAEGTNQLRPWDEYRTIMWVGDTAYKQRAKLPLFFQRLRELGINTAMVYGEGDPQPLLDNRFPYYVENLVNRGLCLKWNSKVRDWDKFVTEWAKSGRVDSALVREYCLDDPEWAQWAGQEVQRIVRRNRDHDPLAYNLRDELSITTSANPFDYDFNPIALGHFREWLQTQYADLAALNTEWETRFSSWAEVKPFTTDQIKNRMASGEAVPRGQPDWQQVQALKFDPAAARRSPMRWNFSPWADFRTYMDLSLARALGELRQAARALDPRTPVGIEGTQMPHAFGGYDLWRLSQVLDWVEPYDVGDAREIFGSFMPGKPILTTVFETDTNHARRRLWHLLLEGDLGCIVWWSEDCIDWNSPDYALTSKAKALAPVLKEMTSPLARLLLRARRERDPVFIHYSQPSIQADWLLESTVDGSTWLRRFSSYEADHNQLALVRESWLKALEDLGYSPQFLSSAQIENGALRMAGPAALVLPGSWAISDKEAGEIRAFCGGVREARAAKIPLPGSQSMGEGEGKSRLTQSETLSKLPLPAAEGVFRGVFCDGNPGLFDGHAKLRDKGALEAIFPVGAAAEVRGAVRGREPSSAPGSIARYAVERLKVAPDPAVLDWLGRQLKPLPQTVSVPARSGARVHRFTVARGELIAFERNITYQMSEELKQAGGNEALEKAVELEVTLPAPAHVYDLRTQTYLGKTDHLRFSLDAWQPSVFALTRDPLATEAIVAALLEE